MLQALAVKVEALRSEAYDVVDALREDPRRAAKASYIIDRLDLVKEAIEGALEYRSSS